jgi:hypothetical protein
VADDKKNSPDYPCGAAAAQIADLMIVRDISGGTRHLRQCSNANQYLPPEPKEQPAAYAIRKSRAVLFNAYERALHGLVGMVFRNEPELSEDVPEVMSGVKGVKADPDKGVAAKPKVEGQLENCDLAGTHWTVFAKELFTDAFEGHAFLYVDMPPKLADGATLADERASNRRPYFVKYKKDQALNWRQDERGKLTQITFEECRMEPDGEYGEREVKRYRVLRPGSWQLYRKVKDENQKESVVLESEGKTSLKEIPVSVCYTKKIKPLVSRPALLDLANINLLHYAEGSDYRTYLHIASRPILWFRGRDKNKKIEPIGPYTFFDVDGEKGNVDFAETTGAALDAARNDLKDLEEHMAILGLSMLKEQAPQKTATEERGDQVRELSELATAAQSLHDCLEAALGFWAQYLGLPSGGSVVLGVSDEDLTFTEQQITAYANLAGSVLSKKTVREILKERGALPESYSEQEEMKRLEAEGAEEAARQREIFNQRQQDFDRGGLPQ